VGDGEPEAAGEAANRVAAAESLWREAGLTPPSKSDLTDLGIPTDQVPDLLEYLIGKQVLIRASSEFIVHAEAFASFLGGLRELFAGKEVLAVGDIGQHFDISRRYSVPLLEYCDRLGYTARREAERRRGPEL
jgi:selenocysteine-specific elongation factor